jgi:hypothetical protein
VCIEEEQNRLANVKIKAPSFLAASSFQLLVGHAALPSRRPSTLLLSIQQYTGSRLLIMIHYFGVELLDPEQVVLAS